MKKKRTGFRGGSPDVGKATRFQPGKCPNPGGRPKEKPILESLREIIDANPALARQIAENALNSAASQLGWFQEVRDMLDGKLSDGTPSGSKDDPVNFDLNVKFIDPDQKK
jgi:hypothetical protein